MLVFTSCNFGIKVLKKVKNKMDLLTYENKIFEAKDKESKKNNDETGNSIVIEYPLFKNQPSLNQIVKTSIINNLIDSTSSDISFNKLTEKVFENFKGEKSKEHFTFKIKATVLNKDSSLVIIMVRGISSRSKFNFSIIKSSFINWDIKKNKLITLTDLFKSGYPCELQTRIEYILINKDSTSQLNNHILKFKHNGKVFMTDIFALTPNGLGLIYEESEFLPNKYGQEELLVPYNKIKSITKPNTVLAQYIN